MNTIKNKCCTGIFTNSFINFLKKAKPVYKKKNLYLTAQFFFPVRKMYKDKGSKNFEKIFFQYIYFFELIF